MTAIILGFVSQQRESLTDV